MIIREFKRPDIKRVLEIEVDSFKDPYPPNILIDIYNLGAGFLVAQHYNIVVGYIIFWIRYEDEGHIISLAVDKKYRKKGAGKKLLDHAIIIFKKHMVKVIKLEVRIKNSGARKFYRKMGFEEKDVLKDYYEDGEDAVIMKKEVGET
ncbi:MAG: ribosomal protein S18-alanine N-acetyltransferase [Methanobacteriaceae archaeon]|jgi:ribosomal-protein-alanine N-acetyltransferase